MPLYCASKKSWIFKKRLHAEYTRRLGPFLYHTHCIGINRTSWTYIFQLRLIFTSKSNDQMCFRNYIYIMILILDGNSEIDAQVKCELYYLICSSHLIRSRAAINMLFFHTCGKKFWVTIWYNYHDLHYFTIKYKIYFDAM